MKKNRIYWIWNYLVVMTIRAKIFFDDHLAKYMPKIPRKKPVSEVCHPCYFDRTKWVLMKIEAYFIGSSDGWDFYWRCPECQSTKELEKDWFPFVFNWCSEKDLLRIGIEVV